MSIGVYGILQTDVHDIVFESDLAFFFEKKANEYGIGTRMGGNISKYVYERCSNERGKGGIIFELTDSPLDTYAENLFESSEFENDENLFCRIKRVQFLFESLLSYEHVTQITFTINYLFYEGEDSLCIKISEFCDRVITLYRISEDSLPVMKFEITL